MSISLLGDMRTKRRTWTRAIEKAKGTHWKDFLDSAGEGHLWKAASYMRPREAYSNIPPLKQGTEEIVDNTEKAGLFMETFFPRMALPENTAEMEQREEILWAPITEEEAHRARRRWITNASMETTRAMAETRDPPVHMVQHLQQQWQCSYYPASIPFALV